MGLHLAGYFRLSKAADTLLRHGHSTNLKDFYGRAPLWYAAQNGHGVVVKLLLAAGADTNTAAEFHERPSLQAAAEGGYLEVVEKRLAAGADANAAAESDGRIALHEVPNR